ncbi:MAG: exosortase family protein XrtF [Flavobacterium sp.]
MLHFLKKNPVFFFLLKALSLYVAWYLIYELWLHPLGYIDGIVIDNLIKSGEFIISGLGYTLIPEPDPKWAIRTLGIDGTHGIWIGDPCNGITLFALFAGFVLAYPGPLKRKLWFIPLGLVPIHIINILRIVALVFITLFAPNYLEFKHTYTFNIIVYSYVFLLWMIWANKLSIQSKLPNNLQSA